jgi:UDP-N-acetylmuramate dehydrogenase
VELAYKTAKMGLSGMENLSGIPGTIGGAVRMNAGAYGSEIRDIIVSSEYLNSRVYSIDNHSHNFAYRTSVFCGKKNAIILSSTIKLYKKDSNEILNIIKENLDKRKSAQPLEFPNCGSVFKRINNRLSVSKLIDEVGLKGYKVGGAEVSTKHAGFIVNKEGATAKDVLEIIQHIKKVILEKYDIVLEPEVEIIK